MQFTTLLIAALATIVYAYKFSSDYYPLRLMVHRSAFQLNGYSYLYVNSQDSRLYVNLDHIPVLNDSTFILEDGYLGHAETQSAAVLDVNDFHFTQEEPSSGFSLDRTSGVLTFNGKQDFHACPDGHGRAMIVHGQVGKSCVPITIQAMELTT